MRRIGNVSYYNCGDWVEHCTALVENFDGKIELLRLRDSAAAYAASGAA
jgi:UDP-2,3-diacylglucosamine pyrophosphatase LpxH